MFIHTLRSFLLEQADAGTGGGGSGTGGASDAGANGSGGESQQQQQQAAFDFRSLVDEKGSFTEGWQEKLPQDFDPYRKTLANFRDFPSLAKALSDNMTAARQKTDGMLKVPGADAKPEEIAAYHKALGVPEKPEGYGLKQPDQLPEGVVWDQSFADGFSKAAHAAGLTPAQVQALAGWHHQHVSEQGQHQTTEGTRLYEAEQQKIRDAFGDQTDRRMMEVRRMAATVGIPEDHPMFFRADTVLAMAKMAELVSEDRLVTVQQVANKMSPETVANDIMTNSSNPDYEAYNNPSHSRHKQVVAFVNDQMKRAYPG